MSPSPHHHGPRVRAALSGDRGFTMIEVLVASVLLLIGAFATFALLDRGAQATGSSLSRDRGNAVAQELVERATGMRYTRAANDLVAQTAPAALRKGMDPSATGPISTEAVSDLFVGRSRWTVRRAGVDYSVTYRACTTSDRVHGVVINGPFDCDRTSTCTTTAGVACDVDPVPPDPSRPRCGSGLGLGLLSRAADVGAAVPANDVTVRLQLLNLGSLAVADLESCVGQLLSGLGLNGLIDPLCGLLGSPGSLLGPVQGLLNGVLGTLQSGVNIGLCPKADIEQELPDATSGIASSTHVEVTVGWRDRFAATDRTIRQTAVVRRSGLQAVAP